MFRCYEEPKRLLFSKGRGVVMSRRLFCRVLWVAVAVFGFLFLTGAVSAQGGNSKERVKEVQEKHTARLMTIKGVVGTAIGQDQKGQPEMKVYVENEGVAGIPKTLDDVSVAVVVSGKFYALKSGYMPTKLGVHPARWKRPVPIGVSTGHPAITAGTIGCRVKDSAGKVYALSNNHIYANENNALLGDNILQPGPYDGGLNPQDSIGTLSNFVAIDFGGGNNSIDAAIAFSTEELLGKATPSKGYGTPKSTPVETVWINMPVQKYGRTTGLTKGKITGTNATYDIWYGTRLVRFVNQLVIEPEVVTDYFHGGGDSGSLIVTNDPLSSEKNNRPVGLLFAGSASMTLANPINAVLDAFTVTIDGE
jgi:hypothetical protein